MVQGSSIVLLGLSHLTYLTSIVYNLCSSLIVGSIPINLPSPPSNRDPENGGDGMMAMVYHIYISSSMSRAKKKFPSLWFPVNSRRSHPYVTSRNLWTMCNHLLQLFALSQPFPKQALQVTHVPPHYGIEHFGRDPKMTEKGWFVITRKIPRIWVLNGSNTWNAGISTYFNHRRRIQQV